jgi:DNA-binding MarR family transcriptional regulator
MAARKKKGEANAELVRRVGDAVRRLGAQSVIVSQTVAAQFGLNTTDLECLDLIQLEGQVSAGELATATGLTSGAVTALIDRMERAGYVERVDDLADRRRVLVRIRKGSIGEIEKVYAPMQKRMFGLWSQYSAADLEVVADFLGRSLDLSAACVAELRGRKAGRKLL